MKKRSIFKELLQGLKEALKYERLVDSGRSPNEAAKLTGMRITVRDDGKPSKRKKRKKRNLVR